MKRTFAIVLEIALALAVSLGCGGKTPPPQPEPDPGGKSCRNPELETCTTNPDPTGEPDAGVPPAP